MSSSLGKRVNIYNIYGDSVTFLSSLACPSPPVSLVVRPSIMFLGMQNGRVLRKAYSSGGPVRTQSPGLFEIFNPRSLDCSNHFCFGISRAAKARALLFHHQLANKTQVLKEHTRSIHLLLFLQSKRVVVSAGKNKKLSVTNVFSGKIKGRFNGQHRKMMLTMASSEDQNLLFTSSIDRSIRVFNAVNTRLVCSFALQSPVLDLCFGQGPGMLLAAGFAPEMLSMFRTKVTNLNREIRLLSKQCEPRDLAEKKEGGKSLKKIFSRNFHLIF